MEINNNIQNSFGHKILQFCELPRLRCAICNNSLYRTSDIDCFILSVCGKNASLPSAKSLPLYLDTISHQKATRLDVLELMEKYAKLYPDKSFGEIFELPEVLEYHLQKGHAYFTESFEKCRPIFELMEKNLKLSPEQKAKLSELHKKAINISIGNIPNQVKSYIIMQNYRDFQNEIGEANVAKLIEYAKKIPLRQGSPDFALCHLAGRTDAHIMQGFMSPVTPTKKRIVPNDGHGYFLCQPCSTITGFVPFKNLFSLFPNMLKNLQEQLNLIILALAKGHLRGHGDYPVVMRRLVSQATDGERVLNLGNYYRQKSFIVPGNFRPAQALEIERKKQYAQKHLASTLLKETPENVRKYLLAVERQKLELQAREGVSPERIASINEKIAFIRRIYISVLKRDGLI